MSTQEATLQQPLLQAIDLKKHYPVKKGMFAPERLVKALDGVSFNLERGKTLAVVGESVLVTLAACFGGLGASHINDSGFWIVTKYLGLSVADGLKTWTVLTTILGFTGFLITWCVWAVI